MQVIYFTKYTSVGSSSRYRIYQYLPYLHENGIQTTTFAFFGSDYKIYRYGSTTRSTLSVFSAFLRRCYDLIKVPKGCKIVIEYELIPYFPLIFEYYLFSRGCELIVDYDDAVFHKYDKHSNLIVRVLFGKKIEKLMRLSKLVLVGNKYLANYALAAGSKQVELIPTVVDLCRYRLKNYEIYIDEFVIGWIGSPSTTRYLYEILDALRSITSLSKVKIHLIGADWKGATGLPLEIIKWNAETEIDEMCRFDVGIMPLPDDPWTKGKCGLKLIQYMACGLPVIASPVGVNTEIVKVGVNGFLAKTTDEWVSALQLLRSDRDLRKKMGAAGRNIVEEKYCLDVTKDLYLNSIKY